MTKKKTPLEALVWDIVVSAIEQHSPKKPSLKHIHPNATITALYEGDGEAFERTLLNIVQYFRTRPNPISLTLNVSPEDQLDTFEKVSDVFLYFLVRVQGIDPYIYDLMKDIEALED